ncbi:hypothetical protein ACFVZH_33805 [Streptomyces sp. NPDC059534]|uniref:hypothetical protein n=1 Tax=Streptomyces sp. NPDC059534 TaxID=3346859 RepID=UPI0036C3ACC5
MSFDIFVCRFENGERVPLDMDAAREVLAPYVVARGPEPDFLQVGTGAGETADVYLHSPGDITFNRFGGEGITDLLAVLLGRLDAWLFVPGTTVVIRREEDRVHLPEAPAGSCTVVVARTGAEIDAAIRAA